MIKMSKMHKRVVRAHAAMLALAALPAVPALAQSDTQPAAAELQTVTVTAQRRSENIRDVPLAVSALRGEKLDVLNSGGQDIRLLAGKLPSLNVESDYGRSFPRFYIRGQGNTDFDLNASQPVGLVVDDIVQESPMLKGFPVFDVEQVEVLRGPQGTLFGRNSPAGVVKFDSVKPVLKQTEGYASVGFGNYGAFNAEGAYNLPMGETVAARVQNDPAFAQALLDEAITLFVNGEPESAKLILRDLVNATLGFEALAEEIHKPAKSLHRMLSQSGNPTMSNISAVFAAIKRALKVEVHTQIVMA